MRDCSRHVTCMQQWLKVEESGTGIWPLMLYSSFRFVQMHVSGKKYVCVNVGVCMSVGVSVCMI